MIVQEETSKVGDKLRVLDLQHQTHAPGGRPGPATSVARAITGHHLVSGVGNAGARCDFAPLTSSILLGLSADHSLRSAVSKLCPLGCPEVL